MRLRIKSEAAVSHIDWLPDGLDKPARSAAFNYPGGDWQEVTVQLPATGPLGVVRIYLPAQAQPLQIDWIELQSGKEKHRTEF